MHHDKAPSPDDSTAPPDLPMLRLPPLQDESADPRRSSWQECTQAAARPARRPRDDDDDDDDEDEKPRARKKRPKDDDEDDEKKPGKKAAAKGRAEEDDDEDDEDETPERRVPKQGTRRYALYVVNNGLAVFRGTLIALLAIGGYASVHLAFFQLLKVDTGTMSSASGILLMVMLGFLPFPLLVAEGMFLVTPPKADARGAVIAAMTLHVLTIVFGILTFLADSFVTDALLAKRLREFMFAAANFSFWLGFLMVVSYIKLLYYYIGDKPTGNSASTLGLFYVIIVTIGYVMFYCGYALLESIEWLYFVLLPIWFLWDGAITRFVLYLMSNIAQLRERVDRVIYPRDEEEEKKEKEKQQKKAKK